MLALLLYFSPLFIHSFILQRDDVGETMCKLSERVNVNEALRRKWDGGGRRQRWRNWVFC